MFLFRIRNTGGTISATAETKKSRKPFCDFLLSTDGGRSGIQFSAVFSFFNIIAVIFLFHLIKCLIQFPFDCINCRAIVADKNY